MVLLVHGINFDGLQDLEDHENKSGAAQAARWVANNVGIFLKRNRRDRAPALLRRLSD
jgi:hypothetical protein